jgi:hypothetical protein
VFGPNYLIGLTLLGLLVLLVAVGIVGGTLGSDLVQRYASWIVDWATR